jgi:pimeloyl-ACP methyl ester carboxylesterase
MQFVQAADVRTHVETWGAGDPILLIHGASSDMAVFQPTVIPLLKDTYRLTAYDRPGMGFTAKRPANADELGEQAKVAAGVIEAMGLEKPIIVAHSFGGAVALRLALDRPDLVSGLVLMAPVAYEWPGVVAWHAYWSSNPLVGPLFNTVLAQPFTASAVREGIKGTFAPMPVPDNYLEDAAVMRATRPGAMRASAQDLVAAKRELIAQQARYPEITVPVAILSGDGDTVVSTTIHSVKLSQTLPNVKLVILPGVGHVPHEAAPEKVAELVEWVRAQAK